MCDASLGISGDEMDCPSAFERVAVVRLRKAQWCEVCRYAVPVGAFAAKIVTKPGLIIDTVYLHLACRSLFDRAFEGVEPGDGLFYQVVLDGIADEYGHELAAAHKSIVKWSHGGPWVPVDREIKKEPRRSG
jgi:hypothetical protein